MVSLMWVRLGIGMAVVVVCVPLARAQESASFKMTEHVFNSGGHPTQGQPLASASFQISVGSLGDAIVATALESASFVMEVGFLAAYPPPREVSDLVFEDQITLAWEVDTYNATYNLYRGTTDDLLGLGYGACVQPGIGTPTTEVLDDPGPGAAFFYLVTGKNLLLEESTKGFDSGGNERLGTVCP